MSARIQIDRERVADFCRRHQVRQLALFGSVLRDDFRPDSDVDVLVDFAPEALGCLDKGDPFADMPDLERAKLHAALLQAEDEIAAGKSTPAEDLLRELRAAR